MKNGFSHGFLVFLLLVLGITGFMAPFVSAADAVNIRFVDKNDRPIAGATVTLGDSVYTTDEDGEITVPSGQGEVLVEVAYASFRTRIPAEIEQNDLKLQWKELVQLNRVEDWANLTPQWGGYNSDGHLVIDGVGKPSFRSVATFANFMMDVEYVHAGAMFLVFRQPDVHFEAYHYLFNETSEYLRSRSRGETAYRHLIPGRRHSRVEGEDVNVVIKAEGPTLSIIVNGQFWAEVTDEEYTDGIIMVRKEHTEIPLIVKRLTILELP